MGIRRLLFRAMLRSHAYRGSSHASSLHDCQTMARLCMAIEVKIRPRLCMSIVGGRQCPVFACLSGRRQSVSLGLKLCHIWSFKNQNAKLLCLTIFLVYKISQNIYNTSEFPHTIFLNSFEKIGRLP